MRHVNKLSRLAGIAGVDLVSLTLKDVIDGLSVGRFTSAELTRAFLAQIAKYEDTYNAFTFLNPEALAQVRLHPPFRQVSTETHLCT